MDKPIINFVHANGFPSRVYSKLFRLLESKYNILAKDLYAHDARFPITKSWMKTGEEIIEFITQETDQKVIGIGHSFGATTTLNAAFLRPDLFKGIILIEPVLFNGWKDVAFAKTAIFLNVLKYFTPAHKTKGRRKNWPDLERATNYFKSKTLFKNFDEECFNDLLKFGLNKVESGYELAFDVDREVDIFSNLPHHTDKFIGKLINLPGAIISASTTNISTPARMKRLAKHQGFEYEMVDGSHMIPLEHPEIVADLILKYASKF